MQLLRRLGLLLLVSAALAGCFYSLDGSLVGKQRDGADDAFLDGAVEQAAQPDAGMETFGAAELGVADLPAPD